MQKNPFSCQNLVPSIWFLHENTIIPHVFNHRLEITKGTLYSIGHPTQIVHRALGTDSNYLVQLLGKRLSNFSVALPTSTSPSPINNTVCICMNLFDGPTKQLDYIQGIFLEYKLSQACFRSCL
jgi:hypothetical protein